MAKGILNVGGGVVSVDASGNFTVDTGLIADGASVFNETGVDVDFRIESDDNVNMLFVDGGNDRVGIGVATPAAQLEVEQSATGGVVAFTIDNNDTDKVAMSIEAANIDADVLDVSMDAVTTAKGIDITADGLTTGGVLYVDSDSSSTGTRSLATIINNNTAATGTTGLTLQSDAGRGLFIDSNLAAGGYSLEIDSEQTTANTAKIAAVSTSATTLEISSVGVLTGKVVDITADAATTGRGINMSMDGLTTGSALYIDSNSSSTGARDIVFIGQNHASATGSTALSLQSDAGRGIFINSNLAAGGPSLEIDSEHTTANTVIINSDPTTTATIIDMSADGLTTGGALKIDSDSSSTGTRNLVEIINNNTAATGATALKVQQDSSGDAAVFQGGNIRVTKGGSAFQTSLHHAWVMGS